MFTIEVMFTITPSDSHSQWGAIHRVQFKPAKQPEAPGAPNYTNRQELFVIIRAIDVIRGPLHSVIKLLLLSTIRISIASLLSRERIVIEFAAQTRAGGLGREAGS